MSDFVDEYEETLSRLADSLSGVEEHALIGGLAVAIRGVPRTTRDIDILLSVPRIRLPATLDRMRDAGFAVDLEGVVRELRDDGISSVRYGSVRVDLLSAVIGAFVEVVRNARWEELRGSRLRVASAEGLVLLKLIAFRPQDQADILGLVATHRGALDVTTIRRWYEQVGEFTDDRWVAFEGMRAEVG